ncbi:hypothetical protein [Niabella hirudinis]|uniref:hypothetical protein n=1 Tax=Niabella hirudinis TaxID=1285929 RepID=UPI003EBF8E02
MKRTSIVILLAILAIFSKSVSAQNFVLNNPSITPNPAVFPGGKETITFDFYVTQPYTFSSNDASNSYGKIVFSFTKMDPTGIQPTGTGATLFNWTLTNNGGTGASLVYTLTGKSKDIAMQSSPPDAKYKITFADVPVTLAASQAETDIRIAGVFTSPTNATADSPDDNSVVIATYSVDPALPVTFQSYDAKLVGNKLVVNWTTASETNNDFFNIQVMGADSTFKTVGHVASKAENGTSTTALEYSFEKDLSTGTQAVMGIALFAAGFILLLFNRKNKWLYTLLIVCGLGTSAISCRKQSEDKENRMPDRQLVRVVQVDKEGGHAYSKIAVAVRQ